MHRNLIILFVFAGMSFFACNPLGILEPRTVPRCIENMLDQTDPQTKAPIIGLARYELEGKYYFELMPECCDQFTSLYDEDCNFVCHPGGGITGRGDGQCPDWVENLSNRKTLWEKE
jgi:hypothetical protein